MKIGSKNYRNLRLINSVERALRNPETWDTPDLEDVAAVVAGDYVKIGIEGQSPSLNPDGMGGERFWVKVEEVTEDGIFVGSVANMLVIYEIPFGTLIPFEVQNVMDFSFAEETAFAN